MASTLKMYEQVDRTGDNFTYSWIVDGLKGTAGNKKAMTANGWKWLAGKPGSFVTNNEDVAKELLAKSDIVATSNGTHAVHSAPGKLAKVPVMIYATNKARTAEDAAQEFCREYFTNNVREIESWNGSYFSLVYGISTYQVRGSGVAYEIWRIPAA